MALRPSTSSRRTRSPASAAATASAAETVVLPTPPLPETMATRASVNKRVMASHPILAAAMRFRPVLVHVIAVTTAGAGAASVATAASAAQTRPTVDIVDVPGILDPSYVNYIRDEIRDAPKKNSVLIVLQLDAPGALHVPLEKLLGEIRSSRVPVAAWVGPRGARASSGAALVALAAGIRGMAPGASIGPIHPMDLTAPATGSRGQELETREMILVHPLGPMPPTSILHKRWTAQEALDLKIVQLVTPSLAEFLKQLDGVTVTAAFEPIKLSLKSSEVDVRFHKPGPVRRFLHSMTSAALVYILLMTGVALIVFELYQPGFGVAGVTGGLMIAAAAYGLFVLPISWWGMTLFFGGLGLLTFDVAIHGLGVPTIAGTIALVTGWLER